jgi:hypothetical protein
MSALTLQQKKKGQAILVLHSNAYLEAYTKSRRNWLSILLQLQLSTCFPLDRRL